VDNPTPPALPVLHAVTNDEIVGRPSFIEQGRAVMHALGSRGVLQLRAAKMSHRHPDRLIELALTLAEEQQRTGAWLVINDRVDVALIVCARGVQLTTRSLEVLDALQIIMKVGTFSGNPGAATTAIGASVHSLEEGIAARIAGATWAVAGNVMSPPRDADPESGLLLLDRLVRYSGIPVIAIGGIAPQHVASLKRKGTYGIAAIRGIWDVDHPERAVIDYLSAYDSEVGR
jgi:thiamine-phosphate diphosphorylase